MIYEIKHIFTRSADYIIVRQLDSGDIVHPRRVRADGRFRDFDFYRGEVAKMARARADVVKIWPVKHNTFLAYIDKSNAQTKTKQNHE